MLRIIQNSSAQGAKGYYTTADYYSEGQELVGVWRGNGALLLGLTGNVEKSDWDALCDNRNPATGKSLTIRQKQSRRIGYDFNFHVPKSVSLLYGLANDDRIVTAFRESVDETMRDMESEMKVRVRKDGRNEDRISGNMVWGEFIHFTARPVDGICDPHLHAHCFTFSASVDPVEKVWKAGQFGDLKRDAPYFEAVFHSRLANRLVELGLPIERTKTGWEIQGISASTLTKFSRRTGVIEDRAKETGITDPKDKGKLGAKTRERKKKEVSLDELRKLWAERLTEDETAAVETLSRMLGGPRISENDRTASRAVDLAIEHWFERKSVVTERQLIATALKQSVGAATVASVHQELATRNLITAESTSGRLVTTRDVLQQEMRLIDFARRGRGTCTPFGGARHVFRRDWLNKGQRKAVLHVISSADRVILISGKAGVGKTSMMQEAVEAIESGGTKVFTFAPSADASRGTLRAEGFPDSDTVARLLIDEKLQEKIKGNAIWIDEAGLLGTQTTAQVFALAESLDARVILSGDRKQHGAVSRGNSLWLLEKEAGLVPSEIKDIQRQKGAYKQAVQALSEGRMEDGFRQLNDLGWIHEVDTSERYKLLAAEYLATVATGKSALVIAPTHFECRLASDAIRNGLQRSGALGKQERQFQILENANLTVAERRDELNYSPGQDVLVFHQNAKGYSKGQQIVAGDDPLPVDQAERFQVFHPNLLSIAPGDRIRITRNGKTADHHPHRLNNGSVYTVQEFTPRGDIRLTNGWTVAKDFSHFAHGYVFTSHASQGKTVDSVIIAQSSASFPASSQEQIYVSASRAKERVHIYTDDKESLLNAVGRSEDRTTAVEMVLLQDRRERQASLQRIEREAARPAWQHGSKDREFAEVNYER